VVGSYGPPSNHSFVAVRLRVPALDRAGAAHDGPSAMQASGRRLPGIPWTTPHSSRVVPARMGQKTLACSSTSAITGAHPHNTLSAFPATNTAPYILDG
jgi:hypothetical protein